MIQIECLHGRNFFDPDEDLDRNPDNFAPCKRGKNKNSWGESYSIELIHVNTLLQ